MAKKRDEVEETVNESSEVPAVPTQLPEQSEPVRYAPTGYVHHEEPEQ